MRENQKNQQTISIYIYIYLNTFISKKNIHTTTRQNIQKFNLYFFLQKIKLFERCIKLDLK